VTGHTISKAMPQVIEKNSSMKVYTDADKSDTKQYSSSHENVITKSNENG